MSISDKTRKILWGLSGGKCALCGHDLVEGATELDDRAIIGMECHIISGKPEGPRHDSGFPSAQVDGVDNLLLLCANCHLKVDNQENHYSPDQLRKAKQDHEASVRRKLSRARRIAAGVGLLLLVVAVAVASWLAARANVVPEIEVDAFQLFKIVPDEATTESDVPVVLGVGLDVVNRSDSTVYRVRDLVFKGTFSFSGTEGGSGYIRDLRIGSATKVGGFDLLQPGAHTLVAVEYPLSAIEYAHGSGVEFNLVGTWELIIDDQRIPLDKRPVPSGVVKRSTWQERLRPTLETTLKPAQSYPEHAREDSPKAK